MASEVLGSIAPEGWHFLVEWRVMNERSGSRDWRRACESRCNLNESNTFAFSNALSLTNQIGKLTCLM